MWLFIIGFVIFLLLIKKSSGKSSINQNSPSTKELTVADIREYYPYMDSRLALQYRDAIMQGKYSFTVGKGLIEQWDRNRFSKNSRTMQNDNIIIPTSEYTNVTWWNLQQYFPIMDSEMSANYLAEYLIDDSKPFMVKTALLKEWDEKLAEYKNIGSKLQQTADNNNKGIAFEKEGNITSAIEVYEENLKIGYPATHSYIRLMILYRKEKKYEDEIRVIKKAIDLFSSDVRYSKDIIKWQDRLGKLKSNN